VDVLTIVRTKVVIGLMGGDQQSPDARRIGAAIAQLGHILLTGAPVGDEFSEPIHRAAMHAAWLTGRARLIGILPRGYQGRRGDRCFQAIQGATGFYFHTGLDSEERDSITGLTPDSLIFLRGSAGTLCELAYATAAGRRTYFFESSAFLRAKLKAAGTVKKIDLTFAKAQKHCSLIEGRSISVCELKERVRERLATAKDWEGDLCEMVMEVVSTATAEGLAQETGFPACTGPPDHKREFERHVLQLE
jgi:predicted Rossmann-fold nucleotide-binding protein